MGFLDSSSGIVTAILTRKGRELIAKNSGEFRITKFAFSDDEVNYQLYNSATDSDTDILNLPVLEPSSNENAALRFRLVTMPQGSIYAAYLVATPGSLILSMGKEDNGAVGAITISTQKGEDSHYHVTSRNPNIAIITINTILTSTDPTGMKSGIIQVVSGVDNGTTSIDVTGGNTGATISIPVTVTRK